MSNIEAQLKDFFEEHKEYFIAMDNKLNEKIKLKETQQKLLIEYISSDNHLGFSDYQKLKYKLRKELKQVKKEIKTYKKQILRKLKESGIKWKNFRKLKYDTYRFNLTKDDIIVLGSVGGYFSYITSIVLLSIFLPPLAPGFMLLIILGHFSILPMIPGAILSIAFFWLGNMIAKGCTCISNFLQRKTLILNIIKDN